LTDGRERDTGPVAWYADGMRRTHAGGSGVDDTNASATLPSLCRARHVVHPRLANGGARLRLMHVAAALAFASCGGLENGSGIGEGGLGSADASAQDTSAGFPDASGDGAGLTDASGREGGPPDSALPDTGGASCVRTTQMCKALGLSSPCWSCSTGAFNQCQALGSPPYRCPTRDGFTGPCFSCDQDGTGNVYDCVGSPSHFVAQGSMKCSQ
jgi:hypothetical protein